MSTVLVTGANTGFGLLTTIAFAHSGHHVLAAVRNPGDATELDAHVDTSEGRIEVMQLDLTDPAVGDTVTARARQSSGIDVLVNNAGVGAFRAVEDTDAELARRIMETNFFGPLALIRAVTPEMRRRGSGRIINVSSINAIVAFPFTSVYSASKAALESLSEALAAELAPFGVHVTIIQPGAFHTTIDHKLSVIPPSDAYPGMAELFAAARQSLAAHDPERVAQAILDVAAAPEPPFRVQVGDDARRVHHARRTLEDSELMSRLAELVMNT